MKPVGWSAWQQAHQTVSVVATGVTLPTHTTSFLCLVLTLTQRPCTPTPIIITILISILTSTPTPSWSSIAPHLRQFSVMFPMYQSASCVSSYLNVTVQWCGELTDKLLLDLYHVHFTPCHYDVDQGRVLCTCTLSTRQVRGNKVQKGIVLNRPNASTDI